MVLKPQNKKYLLLEDVRISFDEKNGSVHLTSKDPDLKDGFHITLNGGRKAENSLRTLLDEAGLIPPSAEDRIPTYLTRTDDPHPIWNRFLLGETDDTPVTWNSTLHPHIIAVGSAGSGMESFSITLLNHVNQQQDTWESRVINLSGHSASRYRKAGVSEKNIAGTLPDALRILNELSDELERRKTLFKESGLNRYADLPQKPKDVLVVVEYAATLLLLKQYYSNQEQEASEQSKTAAALLVHLISQGAAYGFHVALTAHSTAGWFAVSGMAEYFTARVAIGRLNETASYSLFGNCDGKQKIKHGIKCRSYVQFDTQGTVFQTYTH